MWFQTLFIESFPTIITLLIHSKVIYVGRNVKDACVSWFHHMKMEGFVGEFSQFAPLFRRGETNYNPLISHVVEGWELRNNPNVFFTTYEEMSKDLRAVASRLIKFLGKG